MLHPQRQDSSISGWWSSDSQVRTKESHRQHGDSYFGTFSNMTVQDEFILVLKARLNVINPMVKNQKARGLVLMTMKFGEIMWAPQISSKMSNECFPLILQRGKLTKKRSWGAKLQVIQKITSRYPQRFWRSVPIGVWSARDHFVPLTMRTMRFPSRLVRGIGEQKVGRTLLLLLKTAFA